MSGLIGKVLGQRYELTERIGTGGVSTVFCAHDRTLDRQVAVKLLNHVVATDSDQLQRFGREARSVAKLSHPNIVNVTDAGEDQGHPFIVFEYIEGETLKQRITRQKQLPIGEAVAFAIEIAFALDVAHRKGIIHRDIKPQNVLIDKNGRAKLTDFGIALTLEDEESLTATGKVIGTTDYVAPEQALGEHVTGQSDLYSLGVVLYEMLTGEVPFTAENQVAVAMRHVREKLPDLQQIRPEVPAELAAVVELATAKSPADRYATAEAMAEALEDALSHEVSRTGGQSSSSTLVFRALPDHTQQRLPLRTRFSKLARVLGLTVTALAVAAGVFFALSRAERGTGGNGSNQSKPAGLTAVSLGQKAASDFDPLGGDGEHSEQVNFVLDGDPNTTWSTERYDQGALNKDGVGIAVDAKPGVAARALDVSSSSTGWRAEIYGAKGDLPQTAPPTGWTQLTGEELVANDQRFTLDTAGQKFRHYLVWITKIPSSGSVSISEITLLK